MNSPVYKQYDQERLDAQYNLRARHTDFQQHFDRYDRESARVRKQLPSRLDIAYGDTPLQTLDIFPATAPGSPVLVFIHGGYWQFLDKGAFSFPAPVFVGAGAAYVSLNYDLAPTVTIDEIVQQCRRALVWCLANAESFNGDPANIHVSGHSAGGHLTAMMMTTDWPAHGGLPADLVKGCCAISGLFDLEPLRLSYLNEALGLEQGSARRNSPLYNITRHGSPLIAAVGGEETEEFLRHTGMLTTAWRARGFPCQELTLAGLNHFTVVDELGRAGSPLARAVLAQMGL